MNNTKAIVFGYGELGIAAADLVAGSGSELAGMVIPSNRTGADVTLFRDFAQRRGIPFLVQPPRNRIGGFVEELRELDPDVILVWSYSMVLPPEVISLPPLGCFNIHGGLLPQYRGGHVMQWAIIRGEGQTGVALHRMDEGIDTGPLIAEKRFPIEWSDDAVAVRQKLKAAGLEILSEWWPAIAAGIAPEVAQDESVADYFPLRTPDDGLIDWAESNSRIYNLVRALVRPWPGAFTWLKGQKVTVWRAIPLERNVEDNTGYRSPSMVLSVNECGVRIATGNGDLLLREAEIIGNGAEPEPLTNHHISVGDVLGG